MCKKKTLSEARNPNSAARAGSPAACRGGGGPLILDAGQYLHFAPRGRLLLAFPFFARREAPPEGCNRDLEEEEEVGEEEDEGFSSLKVQMAKHSHFQMKVNYDPV